MDSDNDPATPRVASGVDGVVNGTKFSVTYNVTQSTLHQSVSDIVVASLAECGIEVTVTNLNVTDMFAPGPSGAGVWQGI